MDEFGLQFLKSCLGLLMFRQIPNEAGEVRLTARLHFADRKMHWKGRPVLSLTGYDFSDADDMPLASRSIPLEITVVARTIRVWHQDVDVLTDDFALSMAKLPLRSAAKELDDASTVDHDHRVRDRLQNRLKVTFPSSQRFLDLLLVVDIDHDSAEMARNTLLILHQAATQANPAVRL